MLYLYTEITKYLIISVMILYVFECFLYEIIGHRYKAANAIAIRQRIYMFLIQIFAYSTLCLKTGQLDYAFLAFFTIIILFAVLILSGFIYPRLDKVLLNNMTMLLSIGFIILSRLDFNRALKQFFIVAVSLSVGLFIPKLLDKIRGVSRMGYAYAFAGIIPLSIVLLLGAATNGSKISYSIGGITIQPSELIKILFVFCVASLIGHAKSFFDIVIATIIAALHVIVLVLSRDLGAGLIYFIAYIFMLFIGTRSYLLFGLGMLSGGMASVMAYRIFTHVQVRVKAFLDPFSVIDREGYQITQSLFAIGCGSFLGMGLTKGAPRDIPYVETDFVFAAISEEMGAIFAILMLLVCVSCFMIMMKTSMKAGKKFARLLAAGFGVLYLFQVFLTVGGGIKFIPLTGVTLPFVSYGGSSVLTFVVIFYIVEWVIITYRNDEYEEELEDSYEEEYEEYEDYEEYDNYEEYYEEEEEEYYE